jgi:hypothetical protein
MKKADIWDFNSPILEDLKSFLQVFHQQISDELVKVTPLTEQFPMGKV